MPLKLINNPDAQHDGVESVLTLQDLWDKAYSLGAPRIWTNQYDGTVHAEILFKSRNGGELKPKSRYHANVHDALIEVIEEAWELGARPRH